MNIKELAAILGIVIVAAMVTGCEKDIKITQTSTRFSGTEINTDWVAVASTDTVRNGDTIDLKVSGWFPDSIAVNGIEVIPVVHYLIDGQEVAVSSETEFPFGAQWVVSGLTVGEHTLSAKITSKDGNVTFADSVKSSTITVVERP